MTNALAQNIENNSDGLLNSVMLNSNILTSTVQKQDSKTVDFSNLMNNANAKTQETQTKFIDKAVKTNTSSLNKFALNSKKQSIQKTQDIEKVAQKTVAKNISKNDKEVKNQIVSENAPVKIQDTKKEIKNIDTKNSEENQITKTKKEDKSNLSDINNSSFVEPSPAFSSENLNVNKDTETNNQTPTLLAVTQDINLEKNQKIEDEITEILSEVEDSSDLLSAIEEVSEFIGNSDDLSQDLKEQLNNVLKDLKAKVDELQSLNKSVDFKNLADKLSNAISQDIKNETSKNEIVVSVDKNDVEQDVIADSKLDFEIVDKVKNVVDELNKKLNSETKIDDKELQDTIKDIENILVSKDSEKSTLDLNIDKNELNKKLDIITKNLNKVDLSSDKELVNAIKDLAKLLQTDESKQDIQSNIISDVEFSKEDFAKDDDAFSLLEKIDIDKLSKLEKTDKNTMNQIVEVLSNSVEDETLDNEALKNDIAELIEKFEKNPEEYLENPNKLAQNIQVVQENVKQYLNKTSKEQDLSYSDEQTNVIAEDNSIDLSELFNDLSSKSDDKATNFVQEDEEYNNQELLKEVPDFDLDIDNSFAKIDKNTTINAEKVDVKNIEESLKKALQTQKLLDDMMLSAKTSITTSQSGALSVADEVAKLAMEETSTLSVNTSLQGSVLYDSASGQGTLIKNVAQLLRTAQGAQTSVQNPNLDFSANDIFGQIGDKLQQLKNGAEQKLTMVLRPNDLGRLSIELTSSKIGLTTSIMAQNEDVRAYIEKNIDTLRQQLTDAGINVNNIQIKTAGQEGSTSYDGNQNFNNQQDNKDDLNHQNNKQQHNKENKDKQDTLASMSNYDLHFAKDFSSILNKSISYNLN